ncbi:hypothetical protein [Lapidilactobacillus wuchangensis]|uniref:hypothetical protein n=1 Tax=Lapidilactobacillus wuchangensis TaxID=2486001 RepID=UPI000F78E731|nr:hypothetical protein [Lapidilactobacillus wuchangensis]
MKRKRGSLTILTLVMLTFSLLLIYFVNDYYARQNFDYQNLIYYYQQQNVKLKRLINDDH